MSIVEDLRENAGNHYQLAAANMIEFFLKLMVRHRGQYWEFNNGSDLMNHCEGETAEEAVWNAIEEVKREQRKLSR